MTLDERLRFAIAHKRLLQLSYNGRARVAEPHDYGVKNGSVKLLVYQLRQVGSAGIAQRNERTGWRLLDVSKIAVCNLLDDTFQGSRGQSFHEHMTWDELFARVG